MHAAEPTVQSEVRRKEKDERHMLAPACGIQKDATGGLSAGQQRRRRHRHGFVDMAVKGEGETDGDAETHTPIRK